MDTIHEELITTDHIPFLSAYGGVQVFVLRTDKIHTIVSGNKWFKLRYYLEEARKLDKKRIVTFGGAYSNHIVATAAACKLYGFESTGIIRGEKPENQSHTLMAAQQQGMQLYFISRQAYRLKEIPAALIAEENYFIPEGGYGELGAAGAATMLSESQQFDCVCCATGTGTMLAGLMNANTGGYVLGFSILKNNKEAEKSVSLLLSDKKKEVHINHQFHFGGYAKYDQELVNFMNELYTQTGIPTDFVYTAKLFYGVNSLIKGGYFNNCKKLLIVHSGGLQGNLSLPEGTLMF